MMSIITKSAAELGRMMAAGELTSEELTRASLEQIEKLNPTLNVFLAYDAEHALAQARAVDARRAAGEELGPLAGIPVGVKDNYCTTDFPTTCASRMLEGWVPPYDAAVVERLRAAGMVIVGKTNLDEFAMGSSTETSAFGPSRNPWDAERVPGGSGGGSAAAVASFMVPLAVGSDTGGSIRQPGAVTGTVGVKATYGGSSRYGLVAMASSLDQPGPCARTAEDAALLQEIISGYDPRDSASLNQPVPDLVGAVQAADLAGMKVGVVKEFAGDGYDQGVLDRFNEAVELLRQAGAEIVEVSCPHFTYALPAYYLIQPAELSSNLARFDGMRYGLREGDDGTRGAEEVMNLTREKGFGREGKRRIIIGTYALSAGYYDAYYGSAQKVRHLIQQDFEKAFEQVDVLISPTTPSTAFKVGERTADPMSMYLADLCTIPSNMAGNASGSFPSGLADGLPTGLQVMAPPMEDARVYRVGGVLERALEAKWGGPLWRKMEAL
ncbi:MAG: Asp-tRNA(Asn)/Glu-tRNA(Gln) amidotransferase subunit GatA [Propionibacteriaceae bacterium]|nr:Asp-tRNA(Asn)/Glu-tRNA(Gln) amidotransferase subunit GatA [Propionibacteriaceae bacterium]